MRSRAVVACAALVLCAVAGVTGCSSSGGEGDPGPTGPAASPGLVPADEVPGEVETGEPRTSGPETVAPGGASPADCATDAARISPECEVSGLPSAEIEQGQKAPGAPSQQ